MSQLLRQLGQVVEQLISTPTLETMQALKTKHLNKIRTNNVTTCFMISNKLYIIITRREQGNKKNNERKQLLCIRFFFFFFSFCLVVFFYYDKISALSDEATFQLMFMNDSAVVIP